MVNSKKVTKKVVYGEMRGIFAEMGRTDLVNFVEHELELIENKAKSKTKAVDNTQLASLIIRALTEIGKPVTISELLQREDFQNFTYESNKEEKHLSTSKVSATISALLVEKGGNIIRTQDKRKAYFSIAE